VRGSHPRSLKLGGGRRGDVSQDRYFCWGTGFGGKQGGLSGKTGVRVV